jgi:diaminopimelate epimerase
VGRSGHRLGTYYADPLLGAKLGKTQMLARQVSARGGDIRCELKGKRVLMSGQAVTYLNGVIMRR